MKKPIARFSGADGNVFNLMGIASKAMKAAGQDPKPMLEKVRTQKSYEDAIAVMGEFVEVR